MVEQVRALFDRSIRVKQDVAGQHAATIVAMALEIVASLEQGGKLLLCGNGGSAADAQHMAAEMLVRLRPTLDRAAIPALSLAIDMSSMTACANDYEYDAYFERMTRALGRPGDVLMGITTSGKSASIVRALPRSERGRLEDDRAARWGRPAGARGVRRGIGRAVRRDGPGSGGAHHDRACGDGARRGQPVEAACHVGPPRDFEPHDGLSRRR